MPVIVDLSANLASVSQLETLLRRTFTDAESDAAGLTLAGVSSSIRTFTGQHLSVVEDDAVAIDRERWRSTVWLPELPVISVTSVTVDGVVVPANYYRVDAELGEIVFSSAIGAWGVPTAFVVPRVIVVYSHGFDPLPDDIVGIALEMGQLGIDLPTAGVEIMESIGNYEVKFDPERARVLNDSQKERLIPYRPPVVA